MIPYIILYLVIGLVVLGAFGLIDKFMREVKVKPSAECFCQAILALVLWPAVAFFAIITS